MKEEMRYFFMIFGITLALFGIMNSFEKDHYIWWVMGIATIIFVIISLFQFIGLFKNR
jgi:hypothetical protein